jgi:hypothetical protein
MHLFISYFKKSPAFFLAIILVVVFEVSLHFIPKLYYYDGTGSFFVYLKRDLIENSKEDFDILVLGDSRSLSLMGVKGDDVNPSLYNLSLPAAGPWYYKFLLKKYLKYHKKPKLIVWSADAYVLKKEKTGKFNLNPEIWNEFKHRLLNLFSYSETFEQYEGRELFFISKEYLATSLYSVRYRQVFESMIGARLSTLLSGETAMYARNKSIASLVQNSNGQINLGDFFFAPEGTSEAETKRFLEFFKEGDINSEPLEQFIEFCKENELHVVELNLPKAEGINSTPYHTKGKQIMLDMTRKYENVTYIEFETMDYPVSYFGESIHYSTAGEKVLNKEFLEKIYPKLVEVIHAKK